jgi:hypothetical protein
VRSVRGGGGVDDEEDDAVALLEALSPSSLVGRILGAQFRNPFRRQSGYLVVDIGSSSVKLAESSTVRPARASRRSAWRRCRRRSIQSNVIQDEAPVVDAIRRLRERARHPGGPGHHRRPRPRRHRQEGRAPAQSGRGDRQRRSRRGQPPDSRLARQREPGLPGHRLDRRREQDGGPGRRGEARDHQQLRRGDPRGRPRSDPRRRRLLRAREHVRAELRGDGRAAGGAVNIGAATRRSTS